MFNPEKFDLSKVRTFSAESRKNLVTIDTLRTPGEEPPTHFASEELDLLAERIWQARINGSSIIMFFGAHVIKCGLSRYLIWLLENEFITHLASNGAGSIHDFELAYLGGTSEDVPTAIEDGSFGMWEETGLWMNEAIKQGFVAGNGYGRSLALYIQRNPSKFPYAADCVLSRAFEAGVPVTYHVTIGTDIIHQHPAADFADIGGSSGIDFATLCHAVSGLDGGVHMNVGSAVTGPEVFLKALSIVRNQGCETFHITTANFDILDLGDYHCDIGSDKYDYYYRPRKNVINRPSSCGGTGLYIYGNHSQTLPGLYERLR